MVVNLCGCKYSLRLLVAHGGLTHGIKAHIARANLRILAIEDNNRKTLHRTKRHHDQSLNEQQRGRARQG
jgi:hypothetical protein